MLTGACRSGPVRNRRQALFGVRLVHNRLVSAPLSGSTVEPANARVAKSPGKTGSTRAALVAGVDSRR
jgi:hypothetical protein